MGTSTVFVDSPAHSVDDSTSKTASIPAAPAQVATLPIHLTFQRGDHVRWSRRCGGKRMVLYVFVLYTSLKGVTVATYDLDGKQLRRHHARADHVTRADPRTCPCPHCERVRFQQTGGAA